MIHQMNQAIGHAFVNLAPIMANHVHNAVIKTLQDRGTPGFMELAYIRVVRWSSLLLDRLLEHHRLTPKLRQKGKS